MTTHDASQLGELKEYIDQKLYDVKICDPAIGSGAFPMGLLRELFFCRSAIEPNIVENAANIKRHIIQNNIYGVDIERGAVDIARLRFWLSLIVDEKSPEALPNLDFKIMQGNSLLEQYKGVDLSTMTEKKIGAGESLTFFDSMLDVYRKNLRDKLTEYYACPEHDKKMQLRKDICRYCKVRNSLNKVFILILKIWTCLQTVSSSSGIPGSMMFSHDPQKRASILSLAIHRTERNTTTKQRGIIRIPM